MNKTSKAFVAALCFAALAGSPAAAHEGHRHSAKGTVQAVTAERLDLATTEGKTESFTLSAATRVRRGDSAPRREEIAVGERAVVEYEEKGGVRTVLELKLASPPPSGQAATSSGLSLVETKKVCMVNNQVFPNDQIPVEVQGKTYYGCCAMCKERLANDAEIRTAVDPVSGKTVDKARAVIAARPDGTVLYFESAETLARYRATGR